MPNLIDHAAPPLLLFWTVFFLIPEPLNDRINRPAVLSASLSDSTDQAREELDKSTQRHFLAMAKGLITAATRSTVPASPESASPEPDTSHKLEVVATAYNSLAAQTDSTPDIAAWGDKLKPGMKSIAVSRDLLKMGLKRGSKVRISGLEGEYRVLDKMNKRWTKRIDVYMGENLKAALNFGKRDVVISYQQDMPLLVAENN